MIHDSSKNLNREKIVEASGFLSLLMLIRRSDDNMIRRVVVGAIVNLANGVQHHCQPSTISLYSTIDGKNVAYLST